MDILNREDKDSDRYRVGHGLPGGRKPMSSATRGGQIRWEKRHRMVYDCHNKGFYHIEVWIPVPERASACQAREMSAVSLRRERSRC